MTPEQISQLVQEINEIGKELEREV